VGELTGVADSKRIADRHGMRMPLKLFITLWLFSGGCTPAPESVNEAASSTAASQPPAEATWDEQLAAVRNGQATRIAVSQHSVTREQWLELQTGCEGLTRLEIDHADIEDADLAVLESLPALTLLKLGCEVGDDGLAHISRVTSLEVLNLPEGRFTRESLMLLAELPKLRQLRIHSPHVGDEGLRIIATLPALKYLHLIGCPITAAGLEHLQGMTQLQSFYLDGSDIPDEAIYALLEELPSLHFHRDQLHLPNDPQGHQHEH
jgi:hypothetical protein